ncbi:hypothetical protein KFE25_013474 [Diacronema lutheri]|uniref:SAC3/GANP/THP3 conserved domain-containing protein n=1 Tax=Diacronema lutheri TaxID=2081491 RepID=A0A8J5XSZ3_DIALT|nr:hypothetical protein KFE25_013474 [Diacronema lutheri]
MEVADSRLEAARGTCATMCSARELQERQRCMEINFLEAEPGTERQRHPRGSPALAVKRYTRPAAGRALPLPAEIRPIAVLERTTAHLISLADGPFTGTYAFVADRLRAVVQDLVVQSLNDERAAAIYERIIRFHALSAVRYAEEPAPAYSSYHNHELLSKALVSLMHIYAHTPPADAESSATRAEFHGYQLLLHAGDPMLSLSHASALSPALHRSPPVALALRLLHALSACDGLRVLRLARALPPTAFGCVLHVLSRARAEAVGALRRAYLKQEPLPARWVCDLLLLPAESDALSTAAAGLGLVVESAPALPAGAPADAPAPRALAIDRAVVRVAPPADITQAAPKQRSAAPGGAHDTVLVHAAPLAAWRAGGSLVAAIVNGAHAAWPSVAPVANADEHKEDSAQAPEGAPSSEASERASAADVADDGGGDEELIAMLGTLRTQINASPHFLDAAAAALRPPGTMPPGAEGGNARGGAAEDDELALALKDAIAGMSLSVAGAEPAGGSSV